MRTDAVLLPVMALALMAAAPPTEPEPTLAEVLARVRALEEQLRQRPPPPAPAQDTWSVGGYGELRLALEFFNPDPKKTTPYRQADIDLARVSFFVNSQLSDWLTFNSEIEFEHGGTGAAREVEWDEFGEYEVEIEKGGEIALEQAALEARLPWGFRVRLGQLLVPMGLTTTYHLPTMFSSTRRPESETHLVPVVWNEPGAELQFRTRDLSLRVQVASGLDSTGFSSQRWIAGGTQKMFEKTLFNDVGLAFAADYTGLRGTLLGVSAYTSGVTRNRPKRDLDDVDARVYLGDVHLRGQYGPLRVRGLAMVGTLTHAERITAANASLSNALGAPRTPVGTAAWAVFLEAAFDVLGALRVDTRQQVDVFARYDAYDPMWGGPTSLDNPLMQRQALTVGLNYFPHPRVVLKAEYVSRWINQDNAWRLRQDELSAALGFVL